MFTNTHNAAVSPETRLLSAFHKDIRDRKVYLAGRGESTHGLKTREAPLRVQPGNAPRMKGFSVLNSILSFN